MRKRFALVVGFAAALAAASLPLSAQTPGVYARGRSSNQPSSVGTQGWVFVPGFGLRPVIREQFPVFGWGFDAHHHHVLNQQPGLFGGYFGKRFFAGGYFPFGSSVSSSTVVVVPQIVSVPVAAQTVLSDPQGQIIVPVGLPENWGQVRIIKPSVTAEQPPLPQLTLIVLKDGAIYAATDYWLEDGRIFFVTSAGKQDAVAVRDLDLEMTSRLNAERHVPFILRSR